MQVCATGDLANWMVLGKMVMGVGGAMDLVHGARNPQGDRADGTRREGRRAQDRRAVCPVPYTGLGVVNRLTDLAVLDVTPAGLSLSLVETAPGCPVDDVRAATGMQIVTS